MFCVMLSLLPLLQAAEPPAREPAGLASGWAAIPRSMWLSNYSHAYGAAKTIMVAGPTEDTIVAYNSAQSWSPARGVVNGSFVRMTFGSQEIRGKLLPNGFIVWENGSRWLKERSATARLASPSGSAPNRSRLPPADGESYSYSCAARPAPAGLPRAKRPRTPTRAFISAADEEEAAVKEALYTDLRSLRKQCTAMMGRKGSVRPDGVKLSSAPVSPPVSPPPPAKRSSS